MTVFSTCAKLKEPRVVTREQGASVLRPVTLLPERRKDLLRNLLDAKACPDQRDLGNELQRLPRETDSRRRRERA